LHTQVPFTEIQVKCGEDTSVNKELSFADSSMYTQISTGN